MFIRDLIERLTKTFVQTAISTFAATFIIPNDFTVDGWKRAALAAGVAAAAAALSAVSSMMSRPVGTPGTASLVRPQPATPVLPAQSCADANHA
jgi:hypothetical protein